MPAQDELARVCVEWVEGHCARGPWRELPAAQREEAKLTRSPRVRKTWIERESDVTAAEARRELEEDGVDVDAFLRRLHERIERTIMSKQASPTVDPDDTENGEHEWDDESSWSEGEDDRITPIDDDF